jgi:hypothetical protein
MSTEFPEIFGQTNKVSGSHNELNTTINIATQHGGNGIFYFKEDALFKLVANGNKTLAELGNQTIIDILSNNRSLTKIFPYMCSQMSSKNPAVRLRIAQYFYMVMRNYDLYNINQNSDFIDIFLIGAT